LGTSNDFAAFINIFKTYIGVGILAMPYAYYYTGYILSTIVLSLIAICVIIVMNYLDQVCDEKKINNINIFSEVLGETSLNVYKFFFVFYEIGVCVAYVIFFV
jgi:proton-coupled amino acid transporter